MPASALHQTGKTISLDLLSSTVTFSFVCTLYRSPDRPLQDRSAWHRLVACFFVLGMEKAHMSIKCCQSQASQRPGRQIKQT